MAASAGINKGRAVVALAAAGAALALLSTPVGLLEMIVSSAGLSEVLPAAAPPLGLKARLLLALFVALMAGAAAAAMRREASSGSDAGIEKGRSNTARGASKMGFALSKLAAIARGSIRSADRGAAPSLRRADAHPDAPARTPIFASRDFGGLDIFARTEPGRREILVEPEPEHDPVVPAAGLAMPSAPAPLPETDLGIAVARGPISIARPAPVEEPAPPAPTFRPVSAPPSVATTAETVPAPAPAFAAATSFLPEPVAGLSVRELAERLERGLASRGQAASVRTPAPPRLADMPAPDRAPVRSAVQPDVDEALRAALGTLRTMTARTR